jgi:hypothetical protein
VPATDQACAVCLAIEKTKFESATGKTVRPRNQDSDNFKKKKLLRVRRTGKGVEERLFCFVSRWENGE